MNKKRQNKVKQSKNQKKNKKINKLIFSSLVNFSLRSKFINKQKTIAWIAILITAINFLMVIAFIVYLYFWIKTH